MAKSKYPILVQPRFKDIARWYKAGLTQKEIATNLGVGHTTFQGYKHSHPELAELLLKAQIKTIVPKLENALNKVAFGYHYDVYEEYEEEVVDKNGKTRMETRTKKFTKYAQPSERALIWLLNNKSKDYSNNPAFLRLKKEAMELEKKRQEDKNW